MSTPSNSGLRRLVECDKRNSPLPSLSNAPTVGDTASEAQADEPLAVQADFPNDGDDDDDDDNYDGLDFKRVPYLERRQVERNSRGGPKSWIYRHGWAVWHRKYKKNYWLCRYCHQRRKQEACYEADSTTNAGRHLSSNKPGHSHGPNGPVPIASREGNIMGALAKSQVYIMRSKGIEVSQEVANEIAASFSTSRFQDALKDWVVADNQSLRVIETPQFRAMIAAVSPLAEALLWPVANYLREARSLIHVSFDNWTSTGGQYAFTGLCVHYLNSEGKLVDHLLGLPELHGAHTGNNIAAAATTILRLFGVDNARVGYFVLDNASNNDTAVESLAEELGFIASERRLRCCCHILNLSAQLVIWGKDRSAYENEAAHLEEEEKYMDEWRKYGPVGVLFDVIASICTPQTRQLLERLQCEEAESLGVTPHIRQLVKPVKTRWNSYFNTFVRAAELHGPIDGYIECKLEEHSAATATSRRRKNHRLKDVNYEDLDAPEDHLITNVNLAHCKLAKYYAKFDNAPVYYTATILHPHYKHHLSALWKVPDTHVTARDGVHYRDGWLDNNHRAFLRTGRKDSAATSAHTVTPPRKKPRLGISTSRSAFLQSSIEQSTRQLEASLAEDEYEIWKRQPALAEEDWLSLNPLLYWESVAGQFPILSKFAIDVLTIPAAAADCERTFSELGDMLGTRRLHMKPELISALQSLKSWKRLATLLGTADERLYLAYAERGISRIQDKRYEEGEADLREALRIRIALGNYVPRSGEVNLSWSLLAQGKLEECDELLSETLAGRERALGKDDRESVRTGLVLYALGNLRAAQNRLDESFEFHQRAMRHMRATVGEKDFYTANVAHKIAEHLLRLGRSEESITMANMALDIWSVDPSAHKNEIARTTFLKGRLFEATGRSQKASIAFRVACRLRKEITQEDRDMNSLTTEDFDEIVAFWAR
ncbi:Dimer-Tnp-hAT dimerization containing protein [Pyrenophora tritici-repentis]|uniref:Dimer-Tnp-hAT dimerization containing protein n=1 Tax=Pyrenophora tritici-repentis TaxID=45151 RepID=A0A922N9E8_9PLEO|nr:Dimer-Tnp-hAT dimerization containing protein [Pyrenophora tritici-repentis]